MNDNTNTKKSVTTPHLLACTKEQLKLIYDLLRPTFGDEENTLASNLVANIMKADYYSCGLFLSKYECEQYYGGPEEGGWYAWDVDRSWSEYFEDIDELLEHLDQYLIDEDAAPEVFEAVPSKAQILAYMLEDEEYAGEMSTRSICVAAVAEPGARSYDPYVKYVVEFQPGAEQTTAKEVYC